MPTKRRKITMNISLTKETVDLLTQEAARQDRSRSWLIEWAVKKALDPSQQRPSGKPTPWDATRTPPWVPPVTFGSSSAVPSVPCGPSSETTSTEIVCSQERAPMESGSFEPVAKDELPVGMARNLKGLPE